MAIFREVPCQAIDEPLLATRFPSSDDGIVELAQSIDSLGLLQPVVVVEHEDRYRLVAGNRRLAACRMLGWETIPANVLVRLFAGERFATLVENLQRRDLNPMEEATALHQTIEATNCAQATMAQRLGVSQATVSNRLRLLDLGPDLQGAVARESLAPSSALEIGRIWEPKQQAYYLNLAIRQGATRNTVRAWVAAWLRYSEPSESQEEEHSPANDPESLREYKPASCLACGRMQPLVRLDYVTICPECGDALKARAKGEQ